MSKVVAVTGASSGIGAVLSKELAHRGYRVALLARRKEQLEEVAAACGNPDLVHVVVADVTSRVAVKDAIASILSRWGRIDVWVNNAGRGVSKPVSQLTDEDLTDMMTVNVNSALYGMQEVLPTFTSQKAGQIVNVSSLLGRHAALAPKGIRSAYSGAKHFLNALTDSLREELKADQPYITVTTVSPGVVATEFGLNAKGPDSRANPTAQDPKEVALVIIQSIEEGGTEYYTRPEYKTMIDGVFAAKGKN
jgi:NADP-dependent 3-hydroxy acid dehydrogenase YdfG